MNDKRPTSFLNGFLGRAPFALLGMMGIFSIVGNFMTLEENIHLTLEAWRAVTRPIWDLLFGWLFQIIGWEMPWWLKDYLTMGVITAGAFARVGFFVASRHSAFTTNEIKYWKWIALFSALWPVYSLMIIRVYQRQRQTLNALEAEGYWPNSKWAKPMETQMLSSFIFFEAFVYVLILIAINYALVFSGAPSVEPVVLIWV